MTSIYSERGRKLVHIAMAGFALLLRFTSWRVAAAIALTAVLFNLLALPRLAPRIIRPTDLKGPRAGILFYPLSVLILIVIFPSRLDIVAQAWGVMAFGDGFAALAGLSVKSRRLPWNPAKSVIGLMAFIVAGSVGAIALGAWVAPAVVPPPSWATVLWTSVAAATVAALVETLPIGLDDNLTVPATAASVLWFLSALNWLPPIDRLVLDLLIGAAVSLPVALLTLRAKAVTKGGALTGLIFASVIYAGLYLAGLVVLFMALVLTLAATRIGRNTAAKAESGRAVHERRGADNIIANCLVGTLGAILELFSFDWGLELAAVWFVTGIAAGASDTVASEIGKAFGGQPRSVPTWHRLAPGEPGGVTLVGTIVGVVAAGLIAFPAVAMWLIPSSFMVPIVVGCTVGAFVESTLATMFEERRVLDNNTLNFLNTAAAVALAVWWCSLL